MVSMRGFARIEVLALVALLIGKTCAFPYTSNPYTDGGNSFALDSRHPALGAAPPKDSRAYDVVYPDVTATNSSVAGEANGESRELMANTDIARLEAFFQSKLEVNFEKLKQFKSGSAVTAPWPASYWPTFKDGINDVWDTTSKMSPAEKYARAYGLDPKDFMTKVSQTSGVLSQSTRTQCKDDSDCTRLKDGSACAKRAGESRGNCIPKWFGVCHAWAPAAIVEREPRCPVTKKGVTFQPVDIKALATQAYDGLNLGTVFTGSRYNGADQPENLDDDGRFKDATRRDIGPGFFHIALANIMGMRKTSFIVDVSSGAEVWNQPVRSYDAYTMMEVSKEDALRELFPKKKTYDFNPSAKKLIFVQTKFEYIVEATENGPLVSTGRVDSYTTTVYYEYLLELDGKGDIIGGEWVRDSRKTHPDFLWFPESAGKPGTVTNIGIKYDEVRELLDASADCKAIDDAAGDSESPARATSTPATSTPAPAPAPSDAAPVTVRPTPPTEPGAGTVTADSSLEAMITKWIGRWMAGRGRGRGN